MTQYISKSAIKAEIKRRFVEYSTSILKHYDASKEAKAQELGKILIILDTLEVKEIDLEKEINKYISDNFFGSQTLGFFANRTKKEPNDQDIALCAKHFFELGLSEEAYYEGYQQAEKDNELTTKKGENERPV